jgi:uncharacterized membrane protein YdbT with pleckstrin-like domain
MAYPSRLLSPGERVQFEMRQHWRVLVVPVAVLMAVAVATGLSLAVVPVRWGRWVVLAVSVLVLLRFVVYPFLAWLTTQYVFTDRRIITRTGLLTRKGLDMPLARVNNVSFERTLVERVVGCGTLVVESAADNPGLRIAHVPDVEGVQRDIYRLHEEDDERRRGRIPPTRPVT